MSWITQSNVNLERIYLLTHILKMVTDYEKQPPEWQKLGISVAKLESVAMESLSSFFDDTSKPKNARKKPILKELFKVAKMEEKYLRNEIGGRPWHTHTHHAGANRFS